MKILIWGAGGIGCYYGARLQASGNQVVYVARGNHLEALQNKGLVLRHPDFNFTSAVTALSQEQLNEQYQCDDFDLILLTFKSTATAAYVEEMSQWLRDSYTPILSLQNGVDNEKLLAEALDEDRILGGLAVRIGGHILEPGVVEAKGVAQVVYGQWPNNSNQQNKVLSLLPEAFSQSGIEAFLSSDIQRELWRKLLINNGVNPLSVITETDTRHITADPSLGRTVYKMMEETAKAASYDGVVLERSDIDEMFELISSFDAIKTSMLVDYEKGRPIEVDAICGAVIERCHATSTECPMTELIMALVSVKVSKR